MQALVVDSDARSSGVGEALMREAEAWDAATRSFAPRYALVHAAPTASWGRVVFVSSESALNIPRR